MRQPTAIGTSFFLCVVGATLLAARPAGAQDPVPAGEVVLGGVRYRVEVRLVPVVVAIPPEAVTTLRGDSTPPGATLRWAPPAGATAYEVERADGGTWTAVARTVEPFARDALPLAAGTERTYRVRAVGAGGPGPWSAVTIFANPEVAAVPTVFRYEDISEKPLLAAQPDQEVVVRGIGLGERGAAWLTNGTPLQVLGWAPTRVVLRWPAVAPVTPSLAVPALTLRPEGEAWWSGIGPDWVR